MNTPLANPQGHREAPTPTNTQRQAPGSQASALAGVEHNLLHRYIFWTYERGSFHYDVMVTLILLFLFIAPHFIDFHDRPIPDIPGRSTEVLIRDAGHFGTIRRFVIEVRAEDLRNAHSDQDVRDRINDRVRQIAPDAQVDKISPVKDPRGQIVAYDATVLRGRPMDQE